MVADFGIETGELNVQNMNTSTPLNEFRRPAPVLAHLDGHPVRLARGPVCGPPRDHRLVVEPVRLRRLVLRPQRPPPNHLRGAVQVLLTRA